MRKIGNDDAQEDAELMLRSRVPESSASCELAECSSLLQSTVREFKLFDGTLAN
jgi:hypothetical protein